MDFTFSWFTAWMPSPQTYFAQIINGIDGNGGLIDAIDTVVYRVQQPVVEIFILLATIVWFIFMFKD